MKNVFYPREVFSDLLLLCPVLVCVIEPASAAQVSSEVGNSFPRMNRAFILHKSVPYRKHFCLGLWCRLFPLCQQFLLE